jgi:integrase
MGKRANSEGSIFPYRTGWAAYAWVTTPGGQRRRKYVYGRTREQVHDKWLKLQTQARERPVPTTTPTIAEYLTRWLAEVVEPNLAPATCAYYESLTRLYLIPGVGTRRLDRLTPRDVQTWVNQITATCQCCAQGKDARRPEGKRRCCSLGQCCGNYPSRRTAQAARNLLREALNHAKDVDELVARNVAAMAKAPTPRPRKGAAWSVEEARRFLESARTAADPLYAAYVLILVLGLRRGEALGLAWADVDLPAREVHVRQQLQRVRGRLMLRETKTETSDAPLPLPDICASALRLRRTQQDAARDAAAGLWQETGLVFTTRWGTSIEPRNFNRSFAIRIRAAGVRPITPHDARRTCGSLLAALDVHPRVAMQILRHSRVSLTMEIYTIVPSKDTREALRRLGDYLHGTPGTSTHRPPNPGDAAGDAH